MAYGKSGLCACVALAALLAAAPVAAQSAPAQALPDSAYQALSWRLVGPFRGGRVTAVAGHRAQPTTFYLGATGGGLWRTTDAGTTWKNLSDGFFRTATIGAIAIAPSNPDILYVGTGEAPVRGVAAASGDGVYKSVDGGSTWRWIGLGASRQISRILVDPKNPDIVFAAVQGDPWKASEDRGVYRSDDGGATWKKLLYVDPTTGPSDLSMDAHDPNILYAAMWDHQRTPWNVRSGGPGSGIWKSTDGGAHWSRLGGGLPKLMGRIGVAVSPVDSHRLYAMIEAEQGGVYRSDDAGATWTHTNADQGIRDRGWYYSHIFADPKSVDRVYVLAASMVVSQDGGKRFTPVHEPHGDNHSLWINPDNPDVMVEGNDGGGIVSLDAGRTWSSEMNQPTGQFYRIETDDVWPYRIYSAQQDRSSFRIPSMTTHGGIGEQDWADIGGGESSFVAMDRKHPRLVYATSLLGGVSEFDSDTGTAHAVDPYPMFQGFKRPSDLKWRFNWNAPVRVAQQEPNVIYVGANVLLRSEDRGERWTAISPDLTRARPATIGTIGGPIMIEGAGGETYATLTDIVVSPHDPKTIWTGSDDGLVHLTRDGGASWQDVTPKGLPEADINAIEVSPHDPASAYIAAYRYKFGDFEPYAYKTGDFGKTWTAITEGLPANDFVEVVREDPVRKGLLYAGAGWGAYVSFDDGAHWRPLQLNLPVAPVTDLQVHGDELVASTQGRAIWILDGLEALRAVTPETAAEPAHLFAPAPALRLERGEPAAPNDAPDPPYGATFYYSLASAPAGEVTMDVLDPNGVLIRHFSSETHVVAAADTTVKGSDRQPPPEPLPARAGLNRYSWDLRLAPFTPVDDTMRFVSYHPPRAGPGVYTVRLTVDGKTVEQKLQVLPQPGLTPMSDADWAEQQRVSRRLYDLVNADHRETDLIRKREADLVQHNGDKKLIARLEAWQDQVPQAPLASGLVDRIGYPSRLLSTQILYTLSIADGPAPVSAAVKARTSELEAQWAKMQAEGDRLLKQ
ncbi:MAG TPA: hypothetical protein VGL66_11360 [Caulobacteraceae bacterium]|jgi:photosystem II stability/assembly factor-like uncharacterized protein